jgi:dipeptidyl-peptidase-4
MKLIQPRYILLMIICFYAQTISAQIFGNDKIHWTKAGTGYFVSTDGIVEIDLINHAKKNVITGEQLTPKDSVTPLKIEAFQLSNDNSKALIFTNTAKVWRYHTRGDYWVFDSKQNKLIQIGKNRPAQSLMFAKFSPDGEKIAYVSEHNLFSEDITSGKVTQLTFDGTRKFINGTFDWVYEEELGCRDGFRWSPDGNKIAFWQVDGTATRDYYMLNTTDSVYSHVIPVEYPKVGQPPSPVRIGVININTSAIQWMKIDGDPQQHYLPRMEWVGADTLVVQQLNRKQQESKLIYCNATTGNSTTFYTETDTAFIDIKTAWNDNDPTGWDWINKQKAFIWVSEKDGWRHLYKISRNGKTETLLTNGKYDIASIKCIDEANNLIYFMASPDNATQLYLYKINMDGKSKAELVSSASMAGIHDYDISPTGKFAWHTFSNHNTQPTGEVISLPDNEPISASNNIAANMKVDKDVNIEYTQVTTEDGITVDAWINKPVNFDKKKKYPVVLYVYGEPWSSTVEDKYGSQRNFLYNGDMSADGYIQIAVDNRGSPSLKGAAWRKSIYRKIGVINIRDMAMATKKLLELPYMDTSRVAVWGWSGGGSSTLNLMFQYPSIFKTGISIAAITNELYYDNIYTERYMGLPQENMQDFINASAVTYAKNLQGNLLYIHGTGDDNVHYDNAEALLNELVKYDKQFQFMAYPNRTHSISEGIETRSHLSVLYTNFLQKNCPAGGRSIK